MIADAMVNDDAAGSPDLDCIIEISLLKLRRMQITGVKEERRRLMIVEALHHSIALKIKELEDDRDGRVEPNRSHAFLTILEDALTRLGLDRILKFCITIPDDMDDLPRLRLPGPKKHRELLRDDSSLIQLLYQ